MLSTMTFNIHCWVRGDDHLERMAKVLLFKKPDVIGFQELSNSPHSKWIDRLMAFPGISDIYDYIAQSRGDRTGETTAIFYNKQKFTPVEGSVRWLYCEHGIGCTCSECKGMTVAGCFEETNPDFNADGGIEKSGKDANGTDIYYRIVTYARLKRFEDGKEFVFLNTHVDTHVYSPNGHYETYQLQNRQIEIALNFAKGYIDKGYPVVMTGDFNSRVGWGVIDRIMDAGFLRAEEIAERTWGGEVVIKEENGKQIRHPSYDFYYTNHMHNRVRPCVGIDHIFIHTPNGCRVKTYEFCDQPITASNGITEFPSDHIPRIAYIDL